MLQIALQRIAGFSRQPFRWWLPLFSGLLIALCQPPFNHTTSPLLFPFPFLSFIILLPLFGFSLLNPFRRAVLYCGIFGFCASFGQYFWIALDTAEGVWYLILIGTFLICVGFGLYYLLLGILFRIIHRSYPVLFVVIFPAFWVLMEYSRTLGEVPFPWMLLGYALAPILPLAQLASITGVYGLSFLLVFINCAFWISFSLIHDSKPLKPGLMYSSIAGAVIIVCLIWGGIRLIPRQTVSSQKARFACIQGNINQNHWGTRSLDTSFSIAESLITIAAKENPDCIVLSESALLCYLVRRNQHKARVLEWSNTFHIPLITGALHWNPAPPGSPYEYYVYNTAFFLDTGTTTFQHYFKMKLVPFSEVIPYEGRFPILSRVNLGEADFKAGTEPTLFRINGNLIGVPLICYEIIYPDFVRRRSAYPANVLINITNDGWFGRTSGPFHHAAMSQMRSIENGISLVRSANSGISMLVDPYGRVLKKTGIYSRDILVGEVPIYRVKTFYSRYGDWLVRVSLIIALIAGLMLVIRLTAGRSGKVSSKTIT